MSVYYFKNLVTLGRKREKEVSETVVADWTENRSVTTADVYIIMFASLEN